MKTKENLFARWWPILLVVVPMVLVYWFMLVFRAEFDSWPDSAKDWVPLDAGGYDELVGFASLATFSVVFGFLGILIFSGGLVVHVVFLKRQASRARLKVLAVCWLVFGLFLLFGGWSFLSWMLD